jgi:hypothetical protein
MKEINARLEYYNSLGPLVNFDPTVGERELLAVPPERIEEH